MIGGGYKVEMQFKIRQHALYKYIKALYSIYFSLFNSPPTPEESRQGL